MPDVTAAAPMQPIASGILTVVAGVPVIAGRGFDVSIGAGRGVSGNGSFIIPLDVGNLARDPVSTGLPGDVGIDPRFARTKVTMRGTGAPPQTTITSIGVQYVMGAPGMGATAVEVVLTDVAGNLRDPVPPFGNGFEILVWRANPAPDNAQAQLVGPAYQPAMKFP